MLQKTISNLSQQIAYIQINNNAGLVKERDELLIEYQQLIEKVKALEENLGNSKSVNLEKQEQVEGMHQVIIELEQQIVHANSELEKQKNQASIVQQQLEQQLNEQQQKASDKASSKHFLSRILHVFKNKKLKC